MVQADVWTTRSSPTGMAARVVPALRRCLHCGSLTDGWHAPYCDTACHEADRPQDFYQDDTEADDAPI